MTICKTKEELIEACRDTLHVSDGRVELLNEGKLKDSLVDILIFTAVFSPQEEAANYARWLLRRSASILGIIPASIQPLYEAMGRRLVGGFTVPAINIRGLTYFVAQKIFQTMIEDEVGPVIFEIARSEIGYTFQRPAEYAAAVTAAAIKTGYRGPIFLQGDHFQISAKRFAQDAEKERKAVKDLIKEAIDAGFYNIDIDTSTLVDLSQPTVREQQRKNFTLAAELTAAIRSWEPAGVTISVGGEIGEVGGKNSTVEELEAFMEGYMEKLHHYGENLKGISKISVQTGTTHGGVPLADGTIANVALDFGTLERLSKLAKDKYGLAGAVQHGASTLPEEAFDKFPAVETAEIHLATGFQNIIYDSKSFPADLREEIYTYLRRECADERKPGDTDEQFIYKTRKKGFGPFKKALWHLPEEVKEAIGEELKARFSLLFFKLNMTKTKGLLTAYINPIVMGGNIP